MSNTDTSMDASVAETGNGNGDGNGTRQRVLLIVTAVFVILGVAAFFWWSLVLTQRERTDDAYVGGNQIAVSSQLFGTVISVTADENQLVTAGQVLATLDNVDAKSALDKASSALALSVRQFHQLKEQAEQFDAAVATRRLDLVRAQDDLKRREPLAVNEAIAAEDLNHARDAVAQTQAAVQQAEHQARAAHVMVDGSDVRNNPSVLQAKNAYVDAWLTFQRTTIVAPVTGHVSQRTVQPGQHVQAAQVLLNIIPLSKLWVDANFKEVQLRNLRLGQSAEVKSDLYGSDAIFHGKVTGIGAGTGAAFALLPAQNASGNWIKVIQRVPVRIELDSQEVAQHPLRVGLSTVVTVDTHDRSGSALPNAAISAGSATDVYTLDIAAAQAQADAIIARQL